MTKFPITEALLAYWEAPWSHKRFHFVTWKMWAAQRKLGVSIFD